MASATRELPPVDALALAQALIRCESVTPREGGALDELGRVLQDLGFQVHRLPFQAPGTEKVDNLYARLGTSAPNFCFAGHTDVVPEGDRAAWEIDPYAGDVVDGMLHGRGAADMKAAIACFVAATSALLDERGPAFGGSISLLITGDEEGPAINGTVEVLKWMAEAGEIIDHCLVGEPTNPEALGDMMKIGRRGSLGGHLNIIGTQGHVAYPHLADNPIPRLLATLTALNERQFPDKNPHFQPTNLEITSIDIGNSASNVIPAEAKAHFNIRFNTDFTGDELSEWIRDVAKAHAGRHELDLRISGEPFLTEPGQFVNLLQQSVTAVTGKSPELSTSGGTSDARFIQAYCPVAEFGMVGKTMHRRDEQVAVAEVADLTAIYTKILQHYFAAPPNRDSA